MAQTLSYQDLSKIVSRVLRQAMRLAVKHCESFYYKQNLKLAFWGDKNYNEADVYIYATKEKKMNKNSIIQLIVAIFAFGLFLLSWLVFKNIKISDWVILAVGILDLIVFFLGLKKNKE